MTYKQGLLKRNVNNLKMQKEALEIGAITRFGSGKHQSKFTKKIKSKRLLKKLKELNANR